MGIVRLGPAQKEVEQAKNVKKHHMQRVRRKAIKVSIDTKIPILQPIEVIVRGKEVREATHDIVLYIQNKVSNLPSDESNKWAMSKALSTLSVSNLFPKTTDI